MDRGLTLFWQTSQRPQRESRPLGDSNVFSPKEKSNVRHGIEGRGSSDTEEKGNSSRQFMAGHVTQDTAFANASSKLSANCVGATTKTKRRGGKQPAITKIRDSVCSGLG